MRLILTLAGGGAVPEKDKVKALSTGSITIGRGAGNDWVLPDPDRSLSKTHCTIMERNGRFILVDSSTNGIFINAAAQATERDSQTVLNHGDRLTLGDYTIAVSAINDGSLSAPDPDLGMDYRPVATGAPSFSGLGGSAMPAGPLDIDSLDDPFGRPANPGFQHPIAPVAVQPRGLDPFDQVQSRSGSAGGIGPDDDMYHGLEVSKEWQGASRPDTTPVIAQAMPAMRIVSPAPSGGDIDFDDLIGDLSGLQGGFRPAPAADPFGGAGQPATPQHLSAPAAPADPLGGGMQMPGFPPGAGFHQAGPPPGFNAADLMADLARPHPSDPFAALAPAAGRPAAFAPPPPVQAPPPAAPLMQPPPMQRPPMEPGPAQPPPFTPPPFTPAPFATPPAAAVMTPPEPPLMAPPAVEPPFAFQTPPAVQPFPEPAPHAVPNPFDETAKMPAPHMADEADVDPMAVTTRQAPAAPPVAPVPAAALAMPVQPPTAADVSDQPAGVDARAAFRAFLEGAGAVGSPLIDEANAEAGLRAAGEVFRAMAEGLREILISRAAIKSEMRIEATMIAAQGNNALKFSVTPEDAVAALLAPKRRGYMAPLAAAKEAVSDIKDHEIAVMAGVQTALLSLLRRFDPDELEKRLSLGGLSAVLPGARKSRYWDSFRQVYGDITREAEDDFQAVFGRQFAKAYTEQTRKD
jgi:type VI secretion system protein